jgi:hypothetical protein
MRRSRSFQLIIAAVAMAALGTLLAATPAQAQAPNAVRVVVPQNYPAFVHRTDSAGMHRVDIRGVVLFDHPAGRVGTRTVPIILLSPEHVDARTLRAALVSLHNHRAWGEAAQSEQFSALTSAHAAPQVPRWARGLFAAKLDELADQPMTALGALGRGRAVMIDEPEQFITQTNGSRGNDR